MNFKRDLLLIDIEATGLRPDRHEIIQLAGVLLDKKTLKDKKSFVSYVKPKKWENRDRESMKVNKIGWDLVKNAPSLKQVLLKFKRIFGKSVIVSYYVGIMDIVFLKAAFEKNNIKYPFDYHTFNLWSLFYPYLAAKNRLTSRKDFAGFGLESLIKMFKIKINKNQLHDALVDCRAEAEVLRKIISRISGG